MKLEDYKIIYVASPYDGDVKQIEICENLIKELVRDDKKNNRKNIMYISPLKSFNWLEDVADKEEILNYSLKLLTFCNEIYVLPDYELDATINQCIAVAKTIGIPITFL